jgi:site-specific recombinase XerD
MVNYIEGFIESKTELSIASKKEYKTVILSFYKYIENNKFDFINNQIYESFIIDFENSGHKINSINKYISIINNYFIYMFENGYINKKISNKRIKSRNDKKKKIISKNEFSKIMNLIKSNFPNSERNIMIFSLLFYTELKLKEILLLKNSNFIDDYQFIQLKDKLVYLNKDVVELLKNKKIETKEYLFENNYGNYLSRQAVWKVINKYNSKLSLDLSIDILNRSYKVNKILENYREDL